MDMLNKNYMKKNENLWHEKSVVNIIKPTQQQQNAGVYVVVDEVDTELDIDYIDVNEEGRIKKSIEGKVLDKLNMHKYCCRRMFLGYIDLSEKLKHYEKNNDTTFQENL